MLILYCKCRNFREGFISAKTSHTRSFMKIKSTQNGETTLSFTDKVYHAIFNVANMSFNAICENFNKIFAKISEFTVPAVQEIYTVETFQVPLDKRRALDRSPEPSHEERKLSQNINSISPTLKSILGITDHNPLSSIKIYFSLQYQ